MLVGPIETEVAALTLVSSSLLLRNHTNPSLDCCSSRVSASAASMSNSPSAALAVGSVLLFRDGIHLSWLTLLAGLVGVLLLVLGGLPATVRSRYSTATIGRESMIGEVGEAVADVRPDGVVRVRGALWPAHTSRSTPLVAGAAVRVVAVDGPQLQVEPVDSAVAEEPEEKTPL